MILQKIVEQKKKEISSIKTDLSTLESSKRNFRACLKGKNNIIAEIKRKSPSEGELIENLNIKSIIEIYDKYANAISVVTDKRFFNGDIKDIKEIKKFTALPVLCKDFVIDEKQIFELRYYGADAVLLIASILSKEQINRFIDIAKRYSMDCLLEAHTEEELKKVLGTKAEIIGINNRDLSNFKVDIKTTKKLKKLISKDKIIVSESGFNNINEIESANVNAVLVGTSLLKSENISGKLQSLRKPKVKICGITNMEDAYVAVRYGADFLGFNFYKKSPRYISPEKAEEIIKNLPNSTASVGVFVNEHEESVKKIADFTGLDFLQFHGNETPEYCFSFSSPVIKTFHIKNEIKNNKNYKIFAYMFDTYDEKMFGGTGKSFDFNLIRKNKNKIFLAGGVNINNVEKALAIGPYCVDVCSGVEKRKGIKDARKIKKLVGMVR